MFRQHQKLSTLFIVISVGLLLMVNESYAALTAKLIVNPQQIEIPVGSGLVALTIQATGSNLEFEWKLKGPGNFEGDITDSAVLYRPPKEIKGESESVRIEVIVRDDQGQETTTSTIFSIVPYPPPNGTATPTPTPTATIGVTPPGPDGTVTITTLKDGDVVKISEKVSGTYAKEIQEDIWVLVWPELAPGKGWPQSPDAKKGKPARKKDDKWEVPCYFGGDPQKYGIVVYTATPSASTFISDTLKEWAEDNDFPGLFEDELPEGLVEQHRITVTKK